VAVAGLKESDAEVQALKAENAELKATLASVLDRLAALEKPAMAKVKKG
jgi:hypothetical protein